MARYLVTGGAGFIGSNLVRYILAEGHDAVVVDNFATGKRQNITDFADRVEFIEGDIRDRATMDKAVAGCAAQGTTVVRNAEAMAVTFPGFAEAMLALGANLRVES